MMTIGAKLALFDWVTLRNRRINFGLIGGRVAIVFGGNRPHGSVVVDRLEAVVWQPEGVSKDGRTLFIGALGIVSIVDHLSKTATYANSPKRLHDRLFQLLAGSAFAPEMIRATCRAVAGHPGVGGDTVYFIEHAKRQMQSWSAGNVRATLCT